MEHTDKTLYCSLDIETSGFDPSVADVLEVGFVFFEISKQGLIMIEEWTSVFKPTRVVPANILALTGISISELEQAPAFAEHRDFIQEKLGEATIVGHNVVFDIKFLQAMGIEFSGEVIDTLEIVQFVLPTHQSYNLENLMHVFEVEHKDAHRALADSKASVRLLEKMLRVYQGFPKALKEEMKSLLDRYSFPWAAMLTTPLEALSLPTAAASAAVPHQSSGSLVFMDKTIYNFPLGKIFLTELVDCLSEQPKKIILAVPKLQQAANLWRQGLAHAALPPDLQFNEQKFERAIRRKQLSPEQVKFLLKILVWKHTNWQTESIFDLNLSFFGGQFKDLVAGAKLREYSKAKIVVADHATFAVLSRLGLYHSRQAVVAGLSEFEATASSGLGSKVSWGFVNYCLRSIYNPEFGTGSVKLREPVEELQAASDLFFGLVNALMQTDPPSFQYIKINNDFTAASSYLKVKQAAESYTSKLLKINQQLKSDDLERTAENLRQFFIDQANTVKWIELAENRCVFCLSPLDITSTVEALLQPFSKRAFADALGNGNLLQYFTVRLGLKDYKVQDLNKSEVPSILKQTDLFHEAKASKSSQRRVACYLRPAAISTKDILQILDQKSLPAALLLGSASQVREFYEQNYQTLKQRAFVQAQNSAGGGNRMFRNFSIHSNSLLVATDKFVLKHLSGGSGNGAEPVEQLRLKTLIICRLPFEQFTHPYQEALASRFQKPFEEFSLPRAVYNFHSLLKFFYTDELDQIYICDSKLAKDYAKVFKDYLNQLPDIQFFG